MDIPLKIVKGKDKYKNCGTLMTIHGESCEIKCYHCDNSQHAATSREYSEFKCQKSIKNRMSLNNFSHFEAAEKKPQIQKKLIGKLVHIDHAIVVGDFSH